MKKILIVISFFIFTAENKVQACSCNDQGSFMNTSKYSSLVAYVKVTKFLTYNDIYNKKTPMSMEVEILEVYRGKESRRKVTVWGDNGMLCRPYLSVFKEGQYFVMAFYSGNYGGGHLEEKNSDYSISNCGTYWLTVDHENLTANGNIKSKQGKSTTIKLSKLKVKIAKNGY